MRGLSGKTAIVTGASTLIGAGVVRAFVAAGTRVVMADIADADAALAAELGDGVQFVRTDVTNDAAIDHCLAIAGERFGGPDFLVNLASTYLDHGLATTRADWLTALNVNLVGGVIFTQRAAPIIAARGGGAVVNFASISGKVAQPGRMVYSAAKAAIIGTTRCQAMELAPLGIRVNSVSPGWTWSNIMRDLTGDRRAKADAVAAPFHMLGRTGDPAEVAAGVLFLCSDEAAFITGTDLAVDGGYTGWGPERAENALPALSD